MTKPILIVGGGPAGLAAAHSLGTVGRSSILVEKEDKLGGAPILSGYAKLVPSGEWAKDAIGGMVDRVRDVIPNAKLVYNNSPSFNWTLNFRQQVFDA